MEGFVFNYYLLYIEFIILKCAVHRELIQYPEINHSGRI